jgi:branched-chain amino acid transport system substrate-binding protein
VDKIEIGRRTLLTATGATLLAGRPAHAAAQPVPAGQPAPQSEKVLKVGVLGVMRGPAASWGLVNKYCADVTAQMYNEQGGVDIGGSKYRINIITIDDQLDPERAVAGAEELIRQGIHYIIGPNIDTTAAVVVPLLRSGNAVNIAYAFANYLYTPPQRNSILGMVASYQDGPAIYRYLRDKRGVKRVSFVARNEADSLNQRDQGVEGAWRTGLTVLSSSATYAPGTTDFRPVLAQALRGGYAGVLVGIAGQLGGRAQPATGTPDLVVLSGVAPADAPLMLLALRQLGYKGLVSTETAQDARYLRQVGKAAEGFISVGGASPPETRSPYMQDFVRRYEQLVGEWNDEAGTKVYALEVLLRTLQQAGPEALDDVGPFLRAIPTFAIDNPFLNEKKILRYVGEKTFGQQRQIGVPLVVDEFRDGDFHRLFIGTAE